MLIRLNKDYTSFSSKLVVFCLNIYIFFTCKVEHDMCKMYVVKWTNNKNTKGALITCYT